MPLIPALLQAADTAAGLFGLHDQPFSVDRLLDRARRQTGLSDFGENGFEEPLRLFLDACTRESSLSVFGRFATGWDMTRFLTNLLRLRAAALADPAIARRPIERPIFITGLPRSGTTFLHRLMLEDPGSRGPAVWETIFPLPPAKGRPDKRITTVDRQLRAFERIAPAFAGLHPLRATSPQECSEITAHVFRSLRLDTNYLVPSYRAWLDAAPDRHLPAYQFHRRFLQHLGKQPPAHGRWVLKCPDHLFALEALRLAYPDARIVFVHRDPIKVLLSVAHLTEVLRRPFIRQVDRAHIGREESARWVDGTGRMIEASDQASFQEPICHVHHLDLVRDPNAAVAAVYRHFGIDQPATMPAAIEAYVSARPQGGYRHAAYQFADHGLNEAQEREKFRPYMDRFGILAETGPTHAKGLAEGIKRIRGTVTS